MRSLRGETYGHLTVLERHEGTKKRKVRGADRTYVIGLWRCRCVCGKVIENVSSSHLLDGSILSCGCKRILKHKVGNAEYTAAGLAKLAGCHLSTMWARLRRGMTGEEAVAIGKYPKKKAAYHRATYVLHGKPVMLKDVAAQIGISVSRIAWHLRKAKVQRTLEEVVTLFKPKPAWAPPKQLTASSVDKSDHKPGRAPNRTLAPAPSRPLPPGVVVTPAWATVLRYQAGDPKAGDDLLREHHGLIYKYAKKFAHSYIDFDELLQESRMGALEGFRRCDIVKAAGGAPTTYAMWYADHFVRRYVENHRCAVRLPSGKQELGKRISMLSTDVEMEDGQAALVLPSTDAGADARVVDMEARARVRRLLDTLTARERDILERRFGFGEHDDDVTLREIGEHLGVCHERVRQIQSGAFAKLRKILDKASPKNALALDADAFAP